MELPQTCRWRLQLDGSPYTLKSGDFFAIILDRYRPHPRAMVGEWRYLVEFRASRDGDVKLIEIVDSDRGEIYTQMPFNLATGENMIAHLIGVITGLPTTMIVHNGKTYVFMLGEMPP